MNDKQFTDVMLWFVAALFLSGASSFLGHFALFGDATNVAQGFFDGLSLVVCVAAIVFLARSRQRA